MLYGFLSDGVFVKRQSMYSKTFKVPNVCFLTEQVSNYFHKKYVVTDSRSERLLFQNKKLDGTMLFYFDESKYENSMFSQMVKQQQDAFFTIIEKIALSNGMNVNDLERDLMQDSAIRDYYVQDTLRMSSKSVKAVIPYIDAETTNVDIQMPVYFELKLVFDPAVAETVRIWCSIPAFLDDYPLSTITDVTLPCDHSLILNPDKATGVIDMLIKSNSFSFKELDPAIKKDDHSGLFPYFTKYIVKSARDVNMLPFGILYQGAIPTSLEIRKAIREKLLGYGTAPKETWETILPDLFVTGQFFLIPIWDNVTFRPEKSLFPSICNVNKFITMVKKVFPNMENTFIEKYQELITLGQSEIFITTVPDPLNEKDFSILKCHPTYQNHLQQNPAFAYQEDKTKDFNTRLNRCMSVAQGESTIAEIIRNTFDGLVFLSFVSTGIEYHMLTKESYEFLLLEESA